MILSDVSNLLRPAPLALKWVDAIFVEFFAQGRKEIQDGNMVQELCDPDNADKVAAEVIYFCCLHHCFLL